MKSSRVISDRQFAAILLGSATIVWLMAGVSTLFAAYVENQSLLAFGGNTLVKNLLHLVVNLLPLTCLAAMVGGWVSFGKQRYAMAFKLQAVPFLHLILIAVCVLPVVFLCGSGACQ